MVYNMPNRGSGSVFFCVAGISLLRERPEGFPIALWTASGCTFPYLIFIGAGVSLLRERRGGLSDRPLDPFGASPTPYLYFIGSFYFDCLFTVQ